MFYYFFISRCLAIKILDSVFLFSSVGERGNGSFVSHSKIYLFLFCIFFLFLYKSILFCSSVLSVTTTLFALRHCYKFTISNCVWILNFGFTKLAFFVGAIFSSIKLTFIPIFLRDIIYKRIASYLILNKDFLFILLE